MFHLTKQRGLQPDWLHRHRLIRGQYSTSKLNWTVSTKNHAVYLAKLDPSDDWMGKSWIGMYHSAVYCVGCARRATRPFFLLFVFALAARKRTTIGRKGALCRRRWSHSIRNHV